MTNITDLIGKILSFLTKLNLILNKTCVQLFFLIFRLHGGLEPLVDLIKDSEEKAENKKLLAAVTGHYEAKILMKLHFDFTRYF